MKPFTIVYAAGVFDIFHYGHINYLQEAKRLGDKLIVGLLSDEGVMDYKSDKPIMNYVERWRVIRAIEGVDYIVEQDNTDPTNTLKHLWKSHRSLFPNILVRADDVRPPVAGQEYIESKGGKVVIVPYSKGISSRDIKNRIIDKWSFDRRYNGR
jgi:rfaE bifunctional protein nucleotidyltransferase chain/domain